MLISTYLPDGWSEQVNATDAAFVRAHQRPARGLVPDIKKRLYPPWPEQMHPMVLGNARLRASRVRGVQATSNVSGTTPVVQSVVERGNG